MMRFLIILALVVVAAAERVRYDGYQVLRLTPQNDRQVKLLRTIQSVETKLDFWTEARGVGKPVDVLIPPEMVARPEGWFEDTPFAVLDESPQASIDRLFDEIESRDNANAFDVNQYNTFEDIEVWMVEEAIKCNNAPHGHFCSVETIGMSYEGRPIKVFHLKKGGPSFHRETHWLDATIHAREWLATATLIRIMDFMLNNYGIDADATRLIDEYDWYFLPVMNPDGYAWTWHPDGDRLWRKNRRPNEGSICFGTDLNRNYDYTWGTEGVSHLPCGGTFCGPSAASEPETQVIQNEAARLAEHQIIRSWTTIHAYGNMWMFPWGTTNGHLGGVPENCAKPADYDYLLIIADATARAIEATHNTVWETGTGCEVIYETSGSTDDYVKGAHGIEVTFCPELRGNNFSPVAAQIRPSFEEVWNGVVAMVDTIGHA